MFSHSTLLTCPKIAWKINRKGPAVCSAPRASVDSIAMMQRPTVTGHHALIQNLGSRPLLDMVVRRLPGDDHIVHVTFTQSGAGDAHELRLLLQFRNVGASQVAHAGAQAADELEDHGLERSTIGDASLNALGNEFCQAVLAGSLALHHALTAQFRAGQVRGALKVALARSLAHGGQRAHASVALEAESLVENGFARALVYAGKQRTDHYRARAGGNSLGDFA